MKEPKSSKSTLFILFILVLLGSILRLQGLRSNYSFWSDEASTARFARGLLQTGVPQISVTGYKENAYYSTVYLTALSMKFFGENEFAARFPQVVAGGALILAVFFIGKEFFNRGVALSASALTSFSYILISWSRQARGYMLLTLFFVLAILFLYRFSKTKKILDLIFFLILLLLSILTHPLGINLIPISIVFILFEGSLLKLLFRKKLAVFSLVATTAVLLIFTNFLMITNLLMSEKIISLFNFRESFVSYFHSLFWRQYTLASFLSLLAFLYMRLKNYASNKKQLILFASIFGIYLSSASFLLYVPFEKYVLPLFPFLFLLTAYSLEQISKTILNNGQKSKLVLLFLTFFIVANGNKFSLKPRNFYSVNLDMQEIPEVDYKAIYGKIREKLIGVDQNKIAIVDIDEEIPAWYLGEGVNGFVPRKNVDSILKRNPLTNYTFIQSVDDFIKVQKDYPKGFLILLEHNFRFYPDGLVEYARENLSLEKREIWADFSPSWNHWPVELYSWGFESK
ncbi:MAG TPA: glycosyltransferase family 39 protein [Clostridia bacterium]|nr:glycosyltransferase family 39 protein [Clostridia bacterium]